MKNVRRILALLLCAALLACVPMSASAGDVWGAGSHSRLQPGEVADIWMEGYRDFISEPDYPPPHILSAACVAQWESGTHTVNVKNTASCASFLAPEAGVYLIETTIAELVLATVTQSNLVAPLEYYQSIDPVSLLSETSCGVAVALAQGEELLVAWRNSNLPDQFNEAAAITLTALGALTALTPPRMEGPYRIWMDVEPYVTENGKKNYSFHDGPMPLDWILTFANGAAYGADLDFTVDGDALQGGAQRVTVRLFGQDRTQELQFISIDDLIAAIALPAEFTPAIQGETVTDAQGNVTLEPTEFALPDTVTVTFADGSKDVFFAQESMLEEGVAFSIVCPQGYTLLLDAYYWDTDPNDPAGWVFRLDFTGNGHREYYLEQPVAVTPAAQEPGLLATILGAIRAFFTMLFDLLRTLFGGPAA
ncbi:MAG: hypothetical protein IKD72_09375 [Clostridia bacterium]|nr:hypothetical protein [Clostridia bacterium]